MANLTDVAFRHMTPQDKIRPREVGGDERAEIAHFQKQEHLRDDGAIRWDAKFLRPAAPELLVEAQGLLDEGFEVPDAARRLGMLTNTLHKAIRAGRLHKGVKKKTKGGGRPGALRGQRVSAA
jgi:hypothetical protein